MFIVIVERDDEDPLVVGFDNLEDAYKWETRTNTYAEKAWPHSYHNYARTAVYPMDPDRAWSRIKSDEREEDDG